MEENKTSGAPYADLSKMNTDELEKLFESQSDAFDRGEAVDISFYRALAEELEKRDPLPGNDASAETTGMQAISRYRRFSGKKEKGKSGIVRLRVFIAAAAAVLLLSALTVFAAVFVLRKAPKATGASSDDETPSGPSMTTVDVYTEDEYNGIHYKIMSQFRSIENIAAAPAFEQAFLISDYELWSQENAEKHEDASAPREMTVVFHNTVLSGQYKYTCVPEYSDHYVNGYETSDGTLFEVSAENGLLEMLCPFVSDADKNKEPLDVYRQFRIVKQYALEIEPDAESLFNDYYAFKNNEDGSFTYRFLSRLFMKDGDMIELSESIEVTVDLFGNLVSLKAPMRGKLVREDMTDLNESFSELHRRKDEIIQEKERKQYGTYLLDTEFWPIAVVTKLEDGTPAIIYICFEMIDASFITDPELRKSADETFDVKVIYILTTN